MFGFSFTALSLSGISKADFWVIFSYVMHAQTFVVPTQWQIQDEEFGANAPPPLVTVEPGSTSD